MRSPIIRVTASGAPRILRVAIDSEQPAFSTHVGVVEGLHLKAQDIRQWAIKGAEQRLVEIAAEATAIFTAFPELRTAGRGFESQPAATAPKAQAKAAAKRRRPTISAEGRARIAAAQKARWAKLKAAKAETDKPPQPAPPAKAKKRNGMSPAARKAQAARMRAYWAAKRKK